MANRIEPFSIFCNLPTLSTSAVFPRMQRVASTAAGFSGSAISFSIPYWLKGITFDTSLLTPGTLVGIAIVIGQNGQAFVGYSQALNAPINHPAYPNSGNPVSSTVYWRGPEPGIYIAPQTEIALYAYGSNANDRIWASAALQLQQP